MRKRLVFAAIIPVLLLAVYFVSSPGTNATVKSPVNATAKQKKATDAARAHVANAVNAVKIYVAETKRPTHRGLRKEVRKIVGMQYWRQITVRRKAPRATIIRAKRFRGYIVIYWNGSVKGPGIIGPKKRAVSKSQAKAAVQSAVNEAKFHVSTVDNPTIKTMKRAVTRYIHQHLPKRQARVVRIRKKSKLTAVFSADMFPGRIVFHLRKGELSRSGIFR